MTNMFGHVEIERSWIYGVALLALCSEIALPASAQAQSQAEQDAGAQDLRIDQIVVNARRREESLQDTPIAVTAFSPEEIENRGYSDISNIAQAVPNMTFNTVASNSGSANAAVVFIRGIGQSDFYPHIDPGVGIYLDGVYISRTTGGVFDTVDLQQVEVLRGPQGTLFGKNTVGGAILLTSKKPGDELGGYLQATTGRFDRIDVKAALDVPLSDELSTRWSFASLNRDGYVTSLLDGTEYGNINSLSARFAMNWRPTDAVEIDLSLDWTRKREESSGTTLLAVDPGTFDGGGNLVSGISAFVNNVFFPPALSDPDQFTFDSRWITGDPYTNFADGSRSKSDLDLFGVGATIAVSAADWLDIKSITAFRMADSDNDRDGDASPTVILHPATRIDQQQFSQELQFSGSAANGRVNWLVGGFFLYEDINFFAPVDIAFVYIDNSAIVTTESWAGFAQASFDVFDGLSITPGMRYTYETKTNEPIIITTGPDFFNPVGPPPGTVLLIDDASASFDEFTPAVSIDYRWNDSLLTYASWSKGFKSGGFSQRIAFPRAESPSFNPEKVSSWEVGFKFDGFDRRFRLNAAAFLANYTDLQVVVFNQVEPLNENAGEARIKGIELEATFVASHFLTLSGGFGYTDAKYTEVRDPRALLSLDDELAYTPEWTGNVSAILNYPVERLKGDIIGRVDWSYRSEVYFDALNTPELLQEAYSLVNLNIGYENTDWGLKILVGATNLTNEKYIIAGFADLITSSLVDATFARPREWYLTIKKSL